ncbi:hypothetical protein [Pyrobaculum calidifontis]|nr:hypothetical protein [Pyrobaculum calidifontis]
MLSSFIKANLLTEEIGDVKKLFEIMGENVIAIMGRDPPREPKEVMNLMGELVAKREYEFLTAEEYLQDNIDLSIRCIKNLHWALCLGAVYLLERLIIKHRDKIGDIDIKSLIEELIKNHELVYRFPIHLFSQIKKFEPREPSSYWQKVSNKYSEIYNKLENTYLNTNAAKFIKVIEARYVDNKYNSYEDVLKNTFREREDKYYYYRVNKPTDTFYTQLLQFMIGFRELDTFDIEGKWFAQGVQWEDSLAEIRRCLEYIKGRKKAGKGRKKDEITERINTFMMRIFPKEKDKKDLVAECGEKCAKALKYMKNFMELIVKQP